MEAAIDSLIYLGDNLHNRYTFMDNDVKYKLRAKASSLDDPMKLNEALLRWYSFVESSNYKSMGSVIEKILMVRKQIIKNYYYQACEVSEKPEVHAEISHYPDMLDNGGSPHTNSSLTKPARPKLDNDDKIYVKVR